jgi:hypothetical protein
MNSNIAENTIRSLRPTPTKRLSLIHCEGVIGDHAVGFSRRRVSP